MYRNRENNLIVANRRNAGVLLVEPKIKAVVDGTISLVVTHDEVVISVNDGSKDEVKYNLRKSDVC